MRNVIRGLLGGLVGALTGGVVFVITWYALALMAGPISGPMPGFYFSLGLSTLVGVLLAMGIRARLGRTVRLLALSLGGGVVGLVVGHLGGRLLYWGAGDQAGSLEALGAVPDGALTGVSAVSIVGAVLGLMAGSVAAAADRSPGSVPGTSSGPGEGGKAPAREEKGKEKGNGGGKKSASRAEELPRSRTPGADEVPLGQHPADDMSVEELLGEDP